MNVNKFKALLSAIIISISFFSAGLLKAESNTESQKLLEQAKAALSSKQLDKAEDYIERLLEIGSNNPEHYFIAGRIAGAQAQEANIFSKLGYARDAEKYFEKALSIDPKHKGSIIGLIRFHEQAPVIAGGEKESIPALVEQLRIFDKKAAFPMDSGKLIDKGDFALLDKYYKEALAQKDEANPEQFKYDFAMQLSNNGYYSKALDTILTVDLSNPELIYEFAAMRYYQVAKLAAESRRELDLGIKSIQQYAELSEDEKTIPTDWVEFRLLQLQFLNAKEAKSKEGFEQLKSKTKDKSLKDKIASFLKEIKS